MEKLISFKLHSYDDKEKLVSALTNNCYIVGAELEKDKLTYRSLGWRIDVYKELKIDDEINEFAKSFLNAIKSK